MLVDLVRTAVIGLGLLSSLTSAPAQSLTEVVRQALGSYPALAIVQARAEAARAEIARARSAHQPQLSVGAGLNAFSSGTLPPALGRSSFLPSARLNLWSGGRIEAEAERAEALTLAGEAQQRLTQDEVALQASEAYLGWLKGHDLLALAQRNLQAHLDTLHDIHTITQVDTGRRIDLAQAQVRVDNARLAVQTRQAELAVAEHRLQRYWPTGALPTQPARLELADTPLARLPTSLQEVLAHLNDALPSLAQLQAQVSAAEAGVRQAQGLYWPSVDLAAARQFNTSTLRFETLTQLQLNMALYNGQATRAQVDAAQAQLRAAQAALQEGRLLHQEKLGQAWQEWASASARAETGAAQSLVGERVVEGYRQQFRLARRSLLDLLNIQADSFHYRNAAQTALHDERIARARLLAAMGDLARRFAWPGDPAPASHHKPRSPGEP